MKAGIIIETVRILPPPDRREIVWEVPQSAQGPLRAQPGCNACDIDCEQVPEPAFVFLERWDNVWRLPLTNGVCP